MSETNMRHGDTVEPRIGDLSTAGVAAVRTKSSPDYIFNDIVQGLYEGRFVPGQRLVEMDLTKSYGVGRGSVREALSRLSAEGIVTLNLHRGAHIRALTRSEVRNILVLLELLIGLSARLAAEQIGEAEHRKTFTASFGNLMSFETKSDTYELVRARNRFYRTIVDIGGNTELARVLPSMHVHLVRVQFRAYQTEAEAERFEDYRRIAEAVLEGNGKRAELAGQRHVKRVAMALDRLPKNAFAPDR
jgi:DNA-binding GntR family transcriptional regulator